MERHEILEAMSELKLYGMRASFDEIAGKGLARRDEIYPLSASLIRAERTHRPGEGEVIEHGARDQKSQWKVHEQGMDRVATHAQDRPHCHTTPKYRSGSRSSLSR